MAAIYPHVASIYSTPTHKRVGVHFFFYKEEEENKKTLELNASYKIVMWFINNAQRMLELVNTIVDSAADIVAHNLAGASAKVENAMAKVVPIAIGFLAGVIGIGNLSKKVGDIIDRVKVPITKAIDWVVDKAVSFADKLGITKMIEKGTKWVQDKVAKIGDKVMGWLGFKKQLKTIVAIAIRFIWMEKGIPLN